MIVEIHLTQNVERDLRKLPTHIVSKLKTWIDLVEINGLEVARKNQGLHDEPLKGKRLGQRSIRLNHSYRAIYTAERLNDRIKIIVHEVNKHAY